MKMERAIAIFALVVSLPLAFVACGGGSQSEEAAARVDVQVIPDRMQVARDQVANFVAIVTGTADTSVSWSVAEAGGGDIDASGRYTAPASTGTFHVVAQSRAAPAISATATVSVVSSQGGSPGCAAEPLRTTGQTYFVCDCQAGASAGCVPGDDANAGTTASAPKRTLSAATALFRGMNGGDTVALCKGGRWSTFNDGGNTWNNARCSASSTCDVRAYDPPWGGDGTRPYIPVSSGGSFAQWTSGTGNDGYRFQGLSIQGSNGTGTAFFIWNATSDVLLCDLAIQRFQQGIQIEPSQFNERRVPTRNFSVISSEISYNSRQGFLGGAHGTLIENNTFISNGTTTFDHSVYLASGAGYETVGFTVRGNYFRRAGTYTNPNNPCSVGTLIGHGTLTNVLLEGNTFDESGDFPADTCSAIGFDRDSDAGNPTAFTNFTIRNNVVKQSGNNPIGLANAHGFVVENNLVIASPREQSVIQLCHRDALNGGTFLCSNGKVRNNTVYGTGTQWAYGIHLNGADETTPNHEVYNNAIYLTGTSPTCQRLSGVAFNSNNACSTTANGTWFNDAGSDFVPSASSPLVNGGTTRGGAAPVTDITGKMRDPVPDIGAYER